MNGPILTEEDEPAPPPKVIHNYTETKTEIVKETIVEVPVFVPPPPAGYPVYMQAAPHNANIDAQPQN